MEWTLTIGRPQLGLQWSQDRAPREVGGQVEFPMARTVLWEWQAGSQALYPVCMGAGGVTPSRLNPGSGDPVEAPKARALSITGPRRRGREALPASPMAPHTCWCPRPPELCAAGRPSPHLTLGELGEETERPLAQGGTSLAQRPSSRGSNRVQFLLWALLPAAPRVTLGLRCPPSITGAPSSSTAHQGYSLSGRENPSQNVVLPRLAGWGGLRGVSSCTWPPSAPRASVPHRWPCNVP